MPEIAQATILVTPVLEGAQQSLTEQMTQAAAPAGQEAGKAAGQSMGQSLGDSMASAGGALTKGVTAPIAAIGAASVAAWKEVDTGLDTIVQKTGASGEALDSMHGILNNITASIPTDFATAGAAIGEVNTRFGLTGQELEDLSGKFVKFADLNGQDVSNSVDSVSKMMAAFGMEAGDAGKMLDALNVVGQQTGVDVGGLADTVATNAKQFQEMGLTAEEAASFLGSMSMAGLDSGTAMMGMKTAMKNAAAEGKGLDEVLAEFEETMQGNGTESEKLAAAYELFGTRAGAAIENAVSNGTISLSDFSSTLGDFEGSVDDTFAGTLGPMDNFTTMLNQLKTTGAELVEAAGPLITDLLGKATEGVKTLSEAWNSLSPEMQETIIAVAGIAAVAGPLLVIGGTIINGISSIAGGLSGLIPNIGGVGSAAGGAAPSLESAGAGFVNAASGALKMIGAAAALYIAAQAISVLVDAAIRITEAGTPAIAVLAGMAIGIGALMGVAAALGPALTAGALGFVAFGASMLMIAGGVAIASAGITLLVTAVTNLVEVISSNAENINSIVSNIGTTVSGVVESVTGGISQIIDSISGGLQGILEGIAGIFDSMGEAALNAGTGFEKLAGAVKDLVNNTGVLDLGATMGAVAGGVKDVSNAASGASAGATAVTSLTKSFASLSKGATASGRDMTAFGKAVGTAMKSASLSISSSKLGTAMKNQMTGAVRAASSGLASIKSAFSNTRFSFTQHIAVPHFSMSGKFNAETGSVPSVSTRWYAKAAEYGALFTSPQIIGVGDAAQPELLIGERKLKELVAGAGNVTNYIQIDGARDPQLVVDELLRQMNMRVRTA